MNRRSPPVASTVVPSVRLMTSTRPWPESGSSGIQAPRLTLVRRMMRATSSTSRTDAPSGVCSAMVRTRSRWVKLAVCSVSRSSSTSNLPRSRGCSSWRSITEAHQRSGIPCPRASIAHRARRSGSSCWACLAWRVSSVAICAAAADVSPRAAMWATIAARRLENASIHSRSTPLRSAQPLTTGPHWCQTPREMRTVIVVSSASGVRTMPRGVWPAGERGEQGPRLRHHRSRHADRR